MEPLFVPVMMIVCFPAFNESGTIMVPERFPWASTKRVFSAVGPPRVILVIVSPAVHPEPTTDTTVPSGPEVGLKEAFSPPGVGFDFLVKRYMAPRITRDCDIAGYQLFVAFY